MRVVADSASWAETRRGRAPAGGICIGAGRSAGAAMRGERGGRRRVGVDAWVCGRASVRVSAGALRAAGPRWCGTGRRGVPGPARRARGWSLSTDCDTSMKKGRFWCHRMLYSLRSACTRPHFWYMVRIIITHSQYARRICRSVSPASLSRGAGQPRLPRNSMTSTWFLSSSGSGQARPAAWRRRRLRISFSAHIFTILRGLLLQ